MSPRARVTLVVASAAVAAAAGVVGAAVLQSEDAERDRSSAPTGPRKGAPPLLLDLGVRADAEAAELRRAARLYERGRRVEAGEIFTRYDSPDAEVGLAFARWPEGTVDRLRELAREQPRSGLVRLNLGLALFWAGRRHEALAAWRAARRVEPDSISAVRAGDLLYPNFPRGLPTFVPGFEPPAGIGSLPPARQLEALADAARGGGAREKLLYGVALQRLGRTLSARLQFDAAAALAPNAAEPKVAAAVVRFDKAAPADAFGRLGPLARRFPRAPTVRFHLGLLLLWLGRVDDAKRQLELARAAGPATPLGREADRFLRRLEGTRANRKPETGTRTN